MPTMIQTHLIICKGWADVKDKANLLSTLYENAIHQPRQCPWLQQAQQYWDYICISHIQWTKKKGKYPHHLKAQNQNKPEVEGNLKENLRVTDRTHQKPKRQMKTTLMIALTIITIMIIILPQVKIVAADLSMVKVVIDNLEASHKEAEAKDLNTINTNFRTIDFSKAHINRIILNTALTANPIFREIKQMTTEEGAVAGVLSTSEDAVMVGPIIRAIMALTSISTICMINKLNSMALPVAYAVVSIIPLSTATKENMT